MPPFPYRVSASAATKWVAANRGGASLRTKFGQLGQLLGAISTRI
jgi:hypothetical protein